MSWRKEPFRAHYRSTLGTDGSSNSYVSYLNLVNELVGGLDERMATAGAENVVDLIRSEPSNRFSKARSQRNCHSALRAYLAFVGGEVKTLASAMPAPRTDRSTAVSAPEPDELADALRQAKALAARYYRTTGRSLGVTGEVAELEASDKLGLSLARARTAGYDAQRNEGWRVQIKGRAVAADNRYRGRCPSITGDGFDSVALVLLDRTSYEAIEIWEAPRDRVLARINAPGSKARNERCSLAITQFKSIAVRVWPATVNP